MSVLQEQTDKMIHDIVRRIFVEKFKTNCFQLDIKVPRQIRKDNFQT